MDARAYLPPLVHFYRIRRRMPSLREPAALYGFRSPNAADKVVAKLVTAGLVEKEQQTGQLLPTRYFGFCRKVDSHSLLSMLYCGFVYGV
jgi:hypothetical protein